ncbi:MAG: type II toxin-antitoxin system RelE/ParE family toxin [Bacteroidetes bacterium]|nr:type II toxin-antitoxin system RelE/ParE family toxin [Bacteroidota bacterium]MBU1679692.1 type II toxin-antitoxin system RelE/ParE family toxin [Bacteroidota bacterium]MBU2506540.1 type II toxin-antitoxin system RelE/ParE family toxin [Bacteroidota bacterium]
MKYKVLIDPQAKQDLKEIFSYVAAYDSIPSANKLLDAIERALYKLEEYPERGHVPIELRNTGIKKYLEIHYKPYRIIFEIEGGLIYIHSVLDGRRNVQEILRERLFR